MVNMAARKSAAKSTKRMDDGVKVDLKNAPAWARDLVLRARRVRAAQKRLLTLEEINDLLGRGN